MLLWTASGLHRGQLLAYNLPVVPGQHQTPGRIVITHIQQQRLSSRTTCSWPVQTAAVTSAGSNSVKPRASVGLRLQTSQCTNRSAASISAVTTIVKYVRRRLSAGEGLEQHGSRRIHRTATHASDPSNPPQGTKRAGSRAVPSEGHQQPSVQPQQQLDKMPDTAAQPKSPSGQSSSLLRLEQRLQQHSQSGTGTLESKKRSKSRLAGGQLQQQQQELLQLQQEGIPSYATFKIAAAGSTDLLLSFLNRRMAMMIEDSASSNRSNTTVHLTNKQRRVLLRQALVAISWHCRTHQLLPAEAQRLQDMMLQHLLPALAPHLARTQEAVLARVVFALGTCAAAVWQDDTGPDTNTSDESTTAEYQVLQATSAAASASSSQQQPVQPREAATAAKQGPSEKQRQQRQRLQRRQQRQQRQQGQHNQQVQHGERAGAGDLLLQQGVVQLGSQSWVQLLLRYLPPQKLSAGALLATWEGCALHEVCPPEDWLAEASTAAYYELQQNKLDFNDVAALLQACAQLEYCPPSWLMHYLVPRAQQQLPMFNPADLAGVLSSLQALSFRPSNTFLRVWCESGSRLLRGMTISQLAAALEALAWAGYNPKPWWAKRFMDASLPLLPVATPDELLLLLDGSLNLRLHPPLRWVHECYCHLRAAKEQLSLSQIADAAHVLANLQPLPDRLVAQHRAWLALCLRQQQLEDVAALSRSELLYSLYATGKLRVRRTKRWLTAALQQLHAQLPGAGPAELVAMFMVFSYFRRQSQARGGVQLGWLRDVLAAVCGCVQEFSSEGLLQLIVACAELEVDLQQQQERMDPVSQPIGSPTKFAVAEDDATAPGKTPAVQQQQEEVVPTLQQHIDVLATSILGHVARMDLVQLSRVCKALESGGGSKRPSWYLQLLQQCKAALAEFV